MFFDTLQRLSQYSVLSSINGARLSTRSLVALLVSEECFWSAKTRKRFERFEIHTSHGPGAEKLLIHIWRKMYTLLFWFNVLVSIVSWVFGLSFFIRGPGFGLKIPRNYLYRNVGNSVPKLTWPQMDSNWSFCLNVPRFTVVICAYTRVCQNCSILLLFCWHELFPVISLGVSLISTLHVRHFLAARFFWIDCWALSMQTNILFCFFATVSVLSCKYNDVTFWLLLNTNNSVFNVFFSNVKCLSILYIVYHSVLLRGLLI